MAGRPVVFRKQLYQIISQLLDIAVEAILVTRELDGFDHCNYYVKIKNENNKYHVSDQLVVKILNVESTKIKDSVESKILACQFLNHAGIHCSKPVKLTNGYYMDTVILQSSDKAGDITYNNHIIYVVEYIEGILLRDTQHKFNHIVMNQLGQLIATVNSKLLEFQSQQRDFFTGDWSLEDDFANLHRYLKYIRIESMRETLTEIFTTCNNAMQESLPSLKRCFIHGDINPGNIVLSKSLSNNSNHTSTNQADATHQSLWIIDFGDFHFGYAVIELGIAIAHIIAESTTNGIINSGHVLAGYLSITHLNTEEYSLIYDIVFARLFQLIVLCEYSYAFNPDNSYIIDRVPQYFQAISMLQNSSRKEIYQIWSEIIHLC